MGKQEAFEEMCKKKIGSDGKYTFTFDQVADIVERNMNIPKEEVIRRLHLIAQIQKKVDNGKLQAMTLLDLN